MMDVAEHDIFYKLQTGHIRPLHIVQKKGQGMLPLAERLS